MEGLEVSVSSPNFGDSHLDITSLDGKMRNANYGRRLWVGSNKILTPFDRIEQDKETKQFHIHLLPIDDKSSGKSEKYSEA